MTEEEVINMYKTFIQSNLLYVIEVWGHSIKPENDILIKAQNKVLRTIFDCKRSDDAWRHSKGRILTVPELYKRVITKTCLKHHFNQLPQYFAENIMPKKNFILEKDKNKHLLRSNKINMFDYKRCDKTYNQPFTNNCIAFWNSSNLKLKSKPYSKTS